MAIRITVLVVCLKHCNIRPVNMFPNICSYLLSKTIRIWICDMDCPRKKNGNEKWKLSIRSIDYFKSTNFWK